MKYIHLSDVQFNAYDYLITLTILEFSTIFFDVIGPADNEKSEGFFFLSSPGV